MKRFAPIGHYWTSGLNPALTGPQSAGKLAGLRFPARWY